MIAVTEKRERGEREWDYGHRRLWKEWEDRFPVSAAHSSESELFGYKNVWEVAQILFLATIIAAIIGITFSFLLDIRITNLSLK